MGNTPKSVSFSGLTDTKQGSIFMRIRQDKSDILLTAPMSFKIDWLSFTVLPSSINNSIVKIRQILDSWGYDLSLFEEIQGRFFYNAGLTLGNYFNIFIMILLRKCQSMLLSQ